MFGVVKEDTVPGMQGDGPVGGDGDGPGPLVKAGHLPDAQAAVVRPVPRHQVAEPVAHEIPPRELAVEGKVQVALCRRIGDERACRYGIERTPVGGDNGRHVLGGLHPPLDLERCNRRTCYAAEVPVGHEVLWREEVVFLYRYLVKVGGPSVLVGLSFDKGVVFPARLGAHAPVPAPSPDDR